MSLDLARRSSGVLLHLTSLPGPPGQGDLGPSARSFAAWLSKAGQAWWQMLPIGPTGAAASPYQSPSAFAGDPLLISLEDLVADGWLSASDLPPDEGGRPADPGRAAAVREPLLRRAHAAFRRRGGEAQAAFAAFRREQAYWLDDYALFAALKARHRGEPWTSWERGLRDRQVPALERARAGLEGEVDHQAFLQWQFHRQWQALRSSARAGNIGLIGDLPIFVSHDSADVWAHRELFELDEHGQPLAVAGVPPDYFSADGQLWGNPLYRWEAHRDTAYRWWVARFWRLYGLFDAVRVDHFIGFHRYWSVPRGAASAREGAYRPGPAEGLFEALRAELGDLPVIAEDLGVVTPEVEALRRRFGFPGMRVLQFSFGGEPEQLPGAYPVDTVAYTGTHDNNTVAAWLAGTPIGSSASANAAGLGERERALGYASGFGSDPAWGMVEGAWSTASFLAVAPVQDLLGLGAEARMNTPGTVEGNWRFRLAPGALTDALALRLDGLTRRHARSRD